MSQACLYYLLAQYHIVRTWTEVPVAVHPVDFRAVGVCGWSAWGAALIETERPIC
jgi:hypothetical protein